MSPPQVSPKEAKLTFARPAAVAALDYMRSGDKNSLPGRSALVVASDICDEKSKNYRNYFGQDKKARKDFSEALYNDVFREVGKTSEKTKFPSWEKRGDRDQTEQQVLTVAADYLRKLGIEGSKYDKLLEEATNRYDTYHVGEKENIPDEIPFSLNAREVAILILENHEVRLELSPDLEKEVLGRCLQIEIGKQAADLKFDIDDAKLTEAKRKEALTVGVESTNALFALAKPQNPLPEKEQQEVEKLHGLIDLHMTTLYDLGERASSIPSEPTFF